jgi:alpha-mannosidase
MFPAGSGTRAGSTIELDDEVVQLIAFKKAEASEHYIARLFEPSGLRRTTTLRLPTLGVEEQLEFAGFEVKTLAIDAETGVVTVVDLLERPWSSHG